MFGALSEKLQSTFSGLFKAKKLSEENISEAIREVRMALLEADVNYGIVKTLIKNIKEKALGTEILQSVTPAQQFIKVVHEELIALMGSDESPLNISRNPSIVMLCGLQGAGKTTHCAKLAHFLTKDPYNKKPFLIACDLQRPAAIEQLKYLGKSIEVPVFSIDGEQDPLKVAKAGLEEAKKLHCDVIIVDTAGRLHIDEELMQQLSSLHSYLKPDETFFVANAMTGQDAANSAAAFGARVPITGSILTMLDSEARAGAALSICEMTKKPLKFEGVGEKIEDLQVFNPTSMADRILGMGDTINLVKKAKEHIDEQASSRLEERLKNATFTYQDFLSALQMIKKMGPLKSLLKMIPGMSQLPSLDLAEDKFKQVEAIILSMTPKEREGLDDLEMSRRRRISKGSGVPLEEVNRTIKSFKQIKQLMKQMPNLKQIQKMMGGF